MSLGRTRLLVRYPRSFASVFSILNHVDSPISVLAQPFVPILRPLIRGYPLPTTDVLIIDAKTQKEAPTGEIGEIWL